jgi:hypothetical protein
MKQTIYKNMHFTFNRLWPFARRMERIFIIDKSCWYENSTGWNKLGGLISSKIHEESIRIAWRPDRDRNKFQIAIYEYHKGERTITKLANIYADEEITVFINDGLAFVNRVGKSFYAENLKYTANFYFGGQDKAPHKMHVKTYKYDKKQKVESIGSIYDYFYRWFNFQVRPYLPGYGLNFINSTLFRSGNI